MEDELKDELQDLWEKALKEIEANLFNLVQEEDKGLAGTYLKQAYLLGKVVQLSEQLDEL